MSKKSDKSKDGKGKIFGNLSNSNKTLAKKIAEKLTTDHVDGIFKHEAVAEQQNRALHSKDEWRPRDDLQKRIDEGRQRRRGDEKQQKPAAPKSSTKGPATSRLGGPKWEGIEPWHN